MKLGSVGQQIAHLGKLYWEHILHVLSCILHMYSCNEIIIIEIFVYFRTVSQISNRLQLEVDEHVYLCFQNNQRGIAGVAYVGGTCSIYQYYRTNINEWITSDANAARVNFSRQIKKFGNIITLF